MGDKWLAIMILGIVMSISTCTAVGLNSKGNSTQCEKILDGIINEKLEELNK